jgi:hypothetical protein
VEFLDAAGRPVLGLTRNITINVVPDKDAVLFISDRQS